MTLPPSQTHTHTHIPYHHQHHRTLPTQPPTSQVAKQICSCLSAQYESHTSSWLAHKRQTKVPSQPCQNVLLAIQTQSVRLLWVASQSAQRIHSWFDLHYINLSTKTNGLPNREAQIGSSLGHFFLLCTSSFQHVCNLWQTNLKLWPISDIFSVFI